MPADHVNTEPLTLLRSYLARMDERIAADVRPDTEGGARVIAGAPLLPHQSPTALLIAAYRAVATTGARPEQVVLSGEIDIPSVVFEELRIEAAVMDQTGDASSITITGMVDAVERCTPMALEVDGDLIYWLGGSDQLDRWEVERKVAEVMVAASRDGLLNAALDVSVGGMATTIAAMAMLGGKGARFWTPEKIEVERALFDATLGGVICIVPRTEELRFSDMCLARYLPIERIGVVDGSVLECQNHFTVAVAELL